jgi:hypothetical protein
MALDSLQGYTIVNRDQGTLVVLGFGLLLRDCWAAVELEDDDEDSPEFLRKSLLTVRNVKRVIKAIEEVIGRLQQLDTAQEQPKELDGSAKSQMAGMGQKKPIARESLTHTAPPVPSTSKQSGLQMHGNIPARDVESQRQGQRQRKPSKKLLGLE